MEENNTVEAQENYYTAPDGSIWASEEDYNIFCQMQASAPFIAPTGEIFGSEAEAKEFEETSRTR